MVFYASYSITQWTASTKVHLPVQVSFVVAFDQLLGLAFNFCLTFCAASGKINRVVSNEVPPSPPTAVVAAAAATTIVSVAGFAVSEPPPVVAAVAAAGAAAASQQKKPPVVAAVAATAAAAAFQEKKPCASGASQKKAPDATATSQPVPAVVVAAAIDANSEYMTHYDRQYFLYEDENHAYMQAVMDSLHAKEKGIAKARAKQLTRKEIQFTRELEDSKNKCEAMKKRITTALNEEMKKRKEVADKKLARMKRLMTQLDCKGVWTAEPEEPRRKRRKYE